MSANNPYKPGLFITLEGVDGAGKSTQLQTIVDTLRELGRDVLLTREPGGTPLGESLRELLLHQAMHPSTETLLMFAARQEHVLNVIEPALLRGRDVVCDRFTAATLAYQGGGKGVPAERIRSLARWVHHGLEPDCTILLDLPVDLAAQRLAASRERDRFEQQDRAFFERVRASYRRQAAHAPDRWLVVDAAQPVDAVGQRIAAHLRDLVQRHALA